MRFDLLRRCAFAAAALAASAGPAAAHHVMGGRTPATFTQGLLSGLGHPIIGVDHLAFVVAVGIAVGVARLSLALPAVFIALIMAACLPIYYYRDRIIKHLHRKGTPPGKVQRKSP